MRAVETDGLLVAVELKIGVVRTLLRVAIGVEDHIAMGRNGQSVGDGEGGGFIQPVSEVEAVQANGLVAGVIDLEPVGIIAGVVGVFQAQIIVGDDLVTTRGGIS